jgi:Tfp pilus assembly protein PilX
MRMRRLFQKQDGIALIMSIGVLSVLTIAGTTVMVYTASNTKTAARSKVDEHSFSLSEAALNNAMAVLANPTNNALDADLLPGTEATASQAIYETGTAKWYGVLDRQGGALEGSTATWTITAIGLYNNPTGSGAAQVRRKLTAKVPVYPTYTQPLNNPSWNYMYATHTGSDCDQTFSNNVGGSSRMYVAGNLCLNNNAGASPSSIIVAGNLDLANNSFVGANTNMGTRVEAYVGGNCRYGTGGSWAACSGNQDARRIYSKLSDGSTIGVNHNPPLIAAPEADWALWYENAIPGPAQSCTTSSGTPPTFDNNYPSRDNSVAPSFNLTPATSYVCRTGPGANTTATGAMTAAQTTISVASASGFPTSAFRIRVDDELMNVTGGFGTTTWNVTRGVNGSTAATHVLNSTVMWDSANTSGEISWNSATKTLTVKGTILIDGSANVSQTSNYNGQATIYLSGTMRFNGSLCGTPVGSSCNFANWDPNKEMLTFVAQGTGGQNPAGTTVEFANNMYFQGGLFATGDVNYQNNASSDGPVMADQILLANNVTTNSFATITTVPVGMPGNPAVYAQPNPPQMFAG